MWGSVACNLLLDLLNMYLSRIAVLQRHFCHEPCPEENRRQSTGSVHVSLDGNETLLQSIFQKHEDKLKIAHLNVRSLLPNIDLVSITLQQSSLDILHT